MAGIFRVSVQTQRKIKDMKEKFKINDTGFICDGKYYFDEQEERFFFYPLSTNDTGLMTTLYVDESFAFERFNHPVWLYINNTYNQSERKYIPMLLDTGKVADNYQLNLFENDYLEIQSFAYQFKKLLILLANEKRKIKDFLAAVQCWNPPKTINQISENVSEPKYRIVKTFDSNNLSMLIDKNKRYNFLNRYGVLMSDIWFDWADDFRYSGKLDRWVARAGKGDKIYVLLDNGNLRESQF